MALSDTLVKHDKPKSKAYTLKDIEGLAFLCHVLAVNLNILVYFRW